MPTDFDFGSLQIWTADGIPIHLCNLADVQTLDDGDMEYTEPRITLSRDTYFTATFDGGFGFRISMKQLAYGWRAKGPIRKRVLQRLWKEEART